jgi:hypothetical protein
MTCSSSRRSTPLDYRRLAAAARPHLPQLVPQWLPDGQRVGAEWVARNPTRDDRRPGSFKINLRTGRWADFATDDKGGDAISLIAYLHGICQRQAAQILADYLEMQS